MNVIIPKRPNRHKLIPFAPDTTISHKMEQQRPKLRKRPRAVIKPQFNLNYAHPPLPIRVGNRKVSSNFKYKPPRKIPKRSESFVKLRDSFFGNRSFGNMAVELVKSAVVNDDEPGLLYTDFCPKITSTPKANAQKFDTYSIDEEFPDRMVSLFENDDGEANSKSGLKRSNPSIEAENNPSQNSKRLRSVVNNLDQTEDGPIPTVDHLMGKGGNVEQIYNTDTPQVKQAGKRKGLLVDENSAKPSRSETDPSTPSCIVINMFTGHETDKTPAYSQTNTIRKFLSNIANSIKLVPHAIAKNERKTAKPRETTKEDTFGDTVCSNSDTQSPSFFQMNTIPNICITPPRPQQKKTHLPRKYPDDTIDNLARFIKEPHLSNVNYHNAGMNRYVDSWIGSDSIHHDFAKDQKAKEILFDKDQQKIVHEPKQKVVIFTKDKTYDERRFDFAYLTPPRHRPVEAYLPKNDYHKTFFDEPNRVQFQEPALKNHRMIRRHHDFPDFNMKSMKAKCLTNFMRAPFTQHEFGSHRDFDKVFVKSRHRATAPRNLVTPKYTYTDYALGTPPRHRRSNSHPFRNDRPIVRHRNLLGHSTGANLRTSDSKIFRKPNEFAFLIEGNSSANETDQTVENVLQSLEAEQFFKNYNGNKFLF